MAPISICFAATKRVRSDYVTLIANYAPLQDSYGGPNYFSLDSTALYQIHVDNNGDAKPDLTFRFRFTNTYKNLTVNANGKNVAVPLINIGPSLRQWPQSQSHAELHAWSW